MANVDYDCDGKVFVWPDGTYCREVDLREWMGTGYTEMTLGEFRAIKAKEFQGQYKRKIEAEKPDHW